MLNCIGTIVKNFLFTYFENIFALLVHYRRNFMLRSTFLPDLYVIDSTNVFINFDPDLVEFQLVLVYASQP